MTRATQGLLMALLGAVLLRLALSEAYLRYVTEWMRWPLVASGVLLMGLAAGLVLHDSGEDDADHDHTGYEQGADVVDHADDGHGHGKHGVPLVTWLLLLPGLVTFVISPPQLGSYLAERRSGEAQVATQPDSLTELSSDEVVPLDVTEFIWRAQDGGETLVDQPVALTGFVSYDKQGHWYVTRMTINCCAADATAWQVQVNEADSKPDRDAWVTVTGTYDQGSGVGTGSASAVSTGPPTVAAIVAADVKVVDPPNQTYE